MAPDASITTPDYKNIPHSHRLPVTHPDVVRIFNKLSRQSLTSLAQQWLAKKNRDFCRPCLATDETDEDPEQRYELAHSYEELQEAYKLLAARNGPKKEVVDRILEGDWRTGISMYQLATAEIQHLLDHPNTLRWTAKRMTRIQSSSARDMEDTNDIDHLPRFQAQTFLMNLARELTPLIKAHYLMTRVKVMPITILRVYVHNSPYSSETSLANDAKSASSPARAVFFIWPNGSPFVYVSLATHAGQVVGSEARDLRDMVLNAIPRAFSRPSRRYQLTDTNFQTKSLETLLHYRGPGRTNAAGGGFSIFADYSFSQNALDSVTTGRADTAQKSDETAQVTAAGSKRGPGRPRKTAGTGDEAASRKRLKIAQGRFGNSARTGDGQAIERFEVRIEDPFSGVPSRSTARPRAGSASDAEEGGDQDEDTWTPEVRVTFTGEHVFAGIRTLVEEGVIDGEKLPGWMTGEAGVTSGTVRQGRIRAKE
jgi:central kinetochore subunit Mis15/CHL4